MPVVGGRRACGVVTLVVVVLAGALSTMACSAGGNSELRGQGERRAVDPRAASATSVPLLTLAVALEQRLAEASPGADLAVAPLPVAVALSQIRSGASGATADELDRMLATPRGPAASSALSEGLSSLDQVLNERSGQQQNPAGRTGSVAVELPNALWLQRGTSVDSTWLDELASTWGTGVRSADFRSDPETARRAVNEWVTRATSGHIEQLAQRGSIASTTRLMATGAGYLKAPWSTSFDETATRLRPFRHLDGSTTTVVTLRNPTLLDVHYGVGDGWTALDLPYLGRDLWMTFVVPDAGRFEEVEDGLDGESLGELVSGLQPAFLDLSIPEFGFTTDVSLLDALRALGLSTGTDPMAADLDAVSAEPLALSAMLHQTFLGIDEQGTQASATNPRPRSTKSIVDRDAGPTAAPQAPGTATTTAPAGSSSAADTTVSGGGTVVTVDRPFLVLVRDRPTGAPIFFGRVLTPSR